MLMQIINDIFIHYATIKTRTCYFGKIASGQQLHVVHVRYSKRCIGHILMQHPLFIGAKEVAEARCDTLSFDL